jgi:hypothetical protein
LVVVEAVVLIVWWFIQVAGDGWAANLNPLSTANIGTTLIQWVIVLGVLLGLNRFLVKKSLAGDPGGLEETG